MAESAEQYNEKVIPPVEEEVLNVREAIFEGDPYDPPFEDCESAAEWLRNHGDTREFDVSKMTGEEHRRILDNDRKIEYYLIEPIEESGTERCFIEPDSSELDPLGLFSNGLNDIYDVPLPLATASILTGHTPWVNQFQLDLSEPSSPYVPSKCQGRLNVMEGLTADKLQKQFFPFIRKRRKEKMKEWYAEETGVVMFSNQDRILMNAIRDVGTPEGNGGKEYWKEVKGRMVKRCEIFRDERDDIYDFQDHSWSYLKNHLLEALEEAEKESLDEEFVNPSNMLFLDEI